MTKLLAIEGTDIRKKIDSCETCPFFMEEQCPPTQWCNLTENCIVAWVPVPRTATAHHAPNGNYYGQERRDPHCPLPEADK